MSNGCQLVQKKVEQHRWIPKEDESASLSLAILKRENKIRKGKRVRTIDPIDRTELLKKAIPKNPDAKFHCVSVKDIMAMPSAEPTQTNVSNTLDALDCISRQAALEAMDTWDKFGYDPDGKLVRYDDDKHYIPYVHYEDMVHAVKNLPSAQPEVIRCKDCKHQEKFFHTDGRRKDGGYYIYGCELSEEYSHVCLDDDYCSRAERRRG